MEKFEGLEIVMKDGTSALIKNVSAEALVGLKQLACGKTMVLEAYRDGKFFDVKVSQIKSWKDLVVKVGD